MSDINVVEMLESLERVLQKKDCPALALTCRAAILEIQRLQLELDRRAELPVYQEAYS